MTVSILSQHQEFGDTLKILRETLGFSLRAMAQELGVSASYLRTLELEEAHPSREFVIKAGQYFFPLEASSQDHLLILCGYLPQGFTPKIQPGPIEIHRALLAENPDDFKSYLALVLILIRSNKTQEAQAMIEKGLVQFNELAQLQSLMASLELSKQNLVTAIEYQESAIKYFKLEEDPERLKPHINLGDLLLSLGIMHFIKSNRHIINKENHIDNKSPSQANQEHHLAWSHLEQARQSFQQALIENPGDIYTLDEMARVIFNQAFLIQEQAEAQLYWQESINCFEKVIQSNDKHVLGSKHLMETNVFMAHAYSKNKVFEKALYLLNIIEAAAPEHWMVYYAKACYFSLKSELPTLTDAEINDLLKESIYALKKGLWLSQGPQKIISSVQKDPDLSHLRERFQNELNTLFSEQIKPLGRRTA